MNEPFRRPQGSLTRPGSNKLLWVPAVVLFVILFGTFAIMRRRGAVPPPLVAVIPAETTSTFWENFRRGASRACDEEGFRMSWDGPEVQADRNAQILSIERALANKASGILLAPVLPDIVRPALDRICEAKIPCIVVDGDWKANQCVSILATDNRKAGELAARRAGKILNGTGRVLAIEWHAEGSSTTERIEAFESTLADEFPGIRIIASEAPDPATIERARTVIDTMLDEHPHVDAVYACNATTTAAALQVLQASADFDRDIKLIGFDSWPVLVFALEDGRIDALVVRHPYRMGYEGVKAIAAAINGQDIPGQIDAGVELITAERLEEPEIRSLLNLP